MRLRDFFALFRDLQAVTGTSQERRERFEAHPPVTGGGRIMQAAPEEPNNGVVPPQAQVYDLHKAHDTLHN